ncbi:MAG TPA: type II/IV secretion system ATPase subunit [Candidatus Methanoperedens sp.]|nr:type II/IV secretion system ATPase subunit [Candidatus Methanoperedens sp.]
MVQIEKKLEGKVSGRPSAALFESKKGKKRKGIKKGRVFSEEITSEKETKPSIEISSNIDNPVEKPIEKAIEEGENNKIIFLPEKTESETTTSEEETKPPAEIRSNIDNPIEKSAFEEHENEINTIPEQKEGKSTPEEKRPLEGMDSIMKRLEVDKTRDLIKEQMTPEKQAVYDIMEDKLVSDIETRLKKLKEIQSPDKSEKPKTFVERIKLLLTKEEGEKESYDPSTHGPLVTFEGIKGYNELERYWVNEPYALVVILFNPEKNTNVYYVVEPKLSDFDDLFLREIKDRLKDVLLFEDIKNDEDKDKILTDKVKRLVKEYSIDISPLTTEKILYFTRRDFIKFGKIDPLMHDDRIEDVSANGFGVPIYLYHKKYTNLATNVIYREDELDSYVIRLAQRCGKHISVAEPMIDATMPDGSRIQMTLGTTITTHGATFTIRKFSEVPITPVDLINWNTFSAEEMAYLWICIENNKSLIYAGGTASGKTSSLNAVSLFIPWQAKIISLEDTRELKLPHPNWIPGVTRDSFTADGKGTIDMYDLLKAALRQRPEFLLVGEVRGKEALTLFQAMSTGHTTFSTMHADSVSSAIHRLENPPISVPRTMIQALNIISIQSQTYVKGKRARRNMKLVEITDIDPTTRNLRTNDIFAWDALTDKFNRVGESKALNEITIRRGWNVGDMKKELMNRQKILEFMVNNKISDFNAIATIIHDYQVTPEKVLKKLLISG